MDGTHYQLLHTSARELPSEVSEVAEEPAEKSPLANEYIVAKVVGTVGARHACRIYWPRFWCQCVEPYALCRT
eukprot:scaffold940_cov569-Prasinococcus_capsulatus_cf.AAC.5